MSNFWRASYVGISGAFELVTFLLNQQLLAFEGLHSCLVACCVIRKVGNDSYKSNLN